MTPSETTIEVPQISSFSDVPMEFWIAMCLQFFILVFAVWAVAKFIKLAVKIATRRRPSPVETTPAADPLDYDFADIAEQMRKERNGNV